MTRLPVLALLKWWLRMVLLVPVVVALSCLRMAADRFRRF